MEEEHQKAIEEKQKSINEKDMQLALLNDDLTESENLVSSWSSTTQDWKEKYEPKIKSSLS